MYLACICGERLKIELHSGRAVGTGVERSVLNEIVSKLLQENTGMWKKVDDDLVLAMEPSSVTPSSERLGLFRVTGYACMLFMLWMNTLPPGLSPAFVLAILDGESSLLDLDFLTKVVPGCAETLRPWPLNHSVPIDISQNEIRNLIYHYMSESCHVRTFFSYPGI
jgi:hypothetical protein